MGLDFSYELEGLVVSFTSIVEIPSSHEPEWDFGDFKGTVSGTNVTHRYKKPGPYKVTLTVMDDSGETSSITKTIEVTGVITHLPKSIYELIDLFIPQETGVEITQEEKEMYITKWQLYIQPLVNREIPISRYSNEDYYEALENQLVMELAVYDIISTHITDLILTAGNSLQGYMAKIAGSSDEEGDGNGNIKAITTGPTEVQFYQDLTDSLSTMYKAYSSSVEPGGILDILRQNLCTLASRLVIFLPFCDVNNRVITPRVVNRRPPSSIIGPNPYKTVLK